MEKLTTGRGGREGSRNSRGWGRREKDTRMAHRAGREKCLARGRKEGWGRGRRPPQGSLTSPVMRIQQGSEQGIVESDFCSHAHCAACSLCSWGPVTEGEPWSQTGGAGGVTSGARSLVN